ncbi:penicillin acylase family protein [Patulibacter brassicae]|uniref:Penicillin acylase family protein n=1 Tax=Patulibacter brassicae TaxID=1705717 RepID=A0ABU4VIS8_9ACTN|nr:penicillin acylase family protein [Patulibacter brassicae]MDX8150725.1 penicillin acylase family protein [Patulibacter brassicae]
MSRRRLALLGLVLALAGAAPAGAAPAPLERGAGDPAAGGVHDVLPPGTDGSTSLPEALAFLADGRRPSHAGDQLPLFAALPRAAARPGPLDLARLYKDATFGTTPAERVGEEHPRDDVTIVRDRRFGVPRVRGATRDGVLFGAGWVAAQDRLFLMDVMRHLARGQLSGFAGGAPGNRALDAYQWSQAPYAEVDLQAQLDALPRRYGAEGARLRRDLEQYVAGINAYLVGLPLRPGGVPAEYLAVNRPLGPERWRTTDLVATAALFGTSFGRGGGQELEVAELLQRFTERFGARTGRALWRQLLAFDDPDAPTTVRRAAGRFPYQTPSSGTPAGDAGGTAILPDRGSVVRSPVVVAGPDAAPARARARRGEAPVDRRPGATRALPGIVGSLPRTMSNALLVSGARSRSGHPLAVMGPQVDFSAPQLLLEQELVGGGIQARGAAFPGLSAFVLVGRGLDYAFSATSGQQDIADTFALPLCDPGGGVATLRSSGVRYRDRCVGIERLVRRTSWTPSLADPTPAGRQELVAERTPLGLVAGRGTVEGRPTAFTVLRSTYGHEIDSAVGIARLNRPDAVHDAESFRRATADIAFATNWFYVDDRDAQYQGAGALPRRAPGATGQLPVSADDAWVGWDPVARTSQRLGLDEQPAVRNQDYVTNWNNKQAVGFASSADSTYGSVYRSQLLDLRVDQALTRGGGRIDLGEAVRAVGLAATTDLRGQKVLPLALRLLRDERDPALRAALDRLSAWAADGWHRRDADGDGRYEHADAIRIMDAWWPRWLRAQFEPALGAELFAALERFFPLDDPPGGDLGHRGSAYQAGWYSMAHKDLRAVLGGRLRERFATGFCGGGSRAACVAALASSLRDALAVPPAEVYRDDAECDRGRHARTDRQRCFDAIVHRPYGLLDQPLADFQNRPTYQLAAEIRGRRPR